jgi:hypothetical protein
MGLSGEEVAMVVKVRAISRQTSADIAERFRERAAQVRARAAEMMAEDIVNGVPDDMRDPPGSPVDTGNYVMSHIAVTSASASGGATTFSENKTTGRNIAQMKALALGNLKRSVSKDAILNSPEIYFTNRAEYADRVEYIGWKSVEEYNVYGKASRMARQRILDAAKEFGMETR